MRTAWWPSSWNRRSFRRGTVWPRWTSMPVGSMPYLTRRGLPVLTLRSSFLRNSSSGTICSTPRRIRASCSSTGFTEISRGPAGGGRQPPDGSIPQGIIHQGASAPRPPWSTVHLEAPDGREGRRVMDDGRFGLVRGPAEGEHVEAGRAAEEAVLLKEMQRQGRQPALLVVVHRGGRPLGAFVAGRAHLDEDDRLAVDGHEVQLAEGAVPVAGNDAIPQAADEAGGGPFGAGAEPAPPPRPACGGRGGHGGYLDGFSRRACPARRAGRAARDILQRVVASWA